MAFDLAQVETIVKDLALQRIDEMPDALVLVNEDGLIVDVNARARLMFGYASAELIGKPIELLVPERLKKRHVQHRDTYMSDPRDRQMGQHLGGLHGRTKRGTEFLVEINLKPIVGEHGQGRFVQAAVRTATEIAEQAARLQITYQGDVNTTNIGQSAQVGQMTTGRDAEQNRGD